MFKNKILFVWRYFVGLIKLTTLENGIFVYAATSIEHPSLKKEVVDKK